MRHNLDGLADYWETKYIEKQAAFSLTGLLKDTGNLIKGGFDALKSGADFAKDNIVKPAAWSVPIASALLAIAVNRMKSPHIVAKNADKRVLLNALDTEIAVMRRQIAEEEDRRATIDKANKKYDRFI
jgi:hypothetical protein